MWEQIEAKRETTTSNSLYINQLKVRVGSVKTKFCGFLYYYCYYYYYYYYYYHYRYCYYCCCCYNFFSLCLLSGKGYRSSETVSLIHLFLSEERSLNIWHTPLVNLREYNPQPPTGRKRSYLQIQTFCQIYSKKILSWFPARISSLAAWLPLANHFHAWRRFHTSK